jgi:hypothetical protein
MAFTIDPSSLGLDGLPAPEPAARPAPPVVAPTQPTTPAVTPNAASTPAAEPRPATPAPAAAAPGTRETIEALRQLLANFQARPPASPAPRQESQSGGLLEALRQRVQTQMAEEGDQRLREIGIGMLRSRSPNFFENLGAGLAAAEEGTRSRTERLRQAAESERQQRALDVEEARRQEELRLRGEEQASAVPLRAAQTLAALEQAGYYRAGGPGQGRGTLTPQGVLGIGNRAREYALREVPEPRAGTPEATADTPELARQRRERRTQIERTYIQSQYALLGMEPPAAAAGGAGTATTGGGAQPSQTLQYPRPQQ